MTHTSWLQRHAVRASFALGLAAAVLFVWWRFDTDIRRARARVDHGSLLIETRCGPIVISARDDSYGTYASAQYTAGRIAGAKFIGFETGGHTWVGHDDEVMAAIVKLLIP